MYGTSSRTVSGCERNCARATGLRGAEPTVKMPWRYPQRVRRECRAEEGNLSVKGRRTTHRPLLRVRATKLRASASLESARKRLEESLLDCYGCVWGIRPGEKRGSGDGTE